MTARRALRWVEPLIGVTGFVIAWEIASRVAANATLVPPPGKVWDALAAMRGSELPQDIAASLGHLAVGYGESRFAGVANDHRHLIAALAAHDVDAAAMIMGAHSNKAKLLLKERVSERAASPRAPRPARAAAVAAFEPEVP